MSSPRRECELENLNWLFYAYGIGWLLIFLYLFQLGRREHNLRQKVSELQTLVEERWKK
jgi:CcmD family protein